MSAHGREVMENLQQHALEDIVFIIMICVYDYNASREDEKKN